MCGKGQWFRKAWFGSPESWPYTGELRLTSDRSEKVTFNSAINQDPEAPQWSQQSTCSFSEFLRGDIRRRCVTGERPVITDYLPLYQEFAEEIRQVFVEWETIYLADESIYRSGDSTTESPSPDATTHQLVQDTLVGKSIGRYRIDQFLGRGGFGEVWKGFDPELDRVVAIKLARRDRYATPKAFEQFQEEARKAASLSHAALVQIYDITKFDDACVIVSEYIDGMSLANRLRQGPVSIDFAISTVIDVARGLQHAHMKNLIHRA
ncbi:MAG: serine/threonine protein kinase [Planctomycetota bacterium]|nr:MAG: serine/threonine protein kinase [Planctomycetota bacterium]